MGLFVLALCLAILSSGYPLVNHLNLEDTYELSENIDLNECYRVETPKIVWEETKELSKKPKPFKQCCPGFKRIAGRCMPVCDVGCDNGICLNPNECMCNEGWTGERCEKECDDTRYGRNCEGFCTCKNKGVCNKKDGTCLCKAGFSGLLCETKCPENSFGVRCESKCRCKNGASCDSIKGKCYCPPGYIGKFCDRKCPDFSYGKDCLHNCNCEKDNTEFCSHIDGTCSCHSGYIGNLCKEECSPFTWGPRCGNECDCGKTTTCHHISGECDCPPGFLGKSCNKTISESIKMDNPNKTAYIITGLVLMAIIPIAIYLVYTKILCCPPNNWSKMNKVNDHELVEISASYSAATCESFLNLSDANDNKKNTDSEIGVRYSTIRRDLEIMENNTLTSQPVEEST